MKSIPLDYLTDHKCDDCGKQAKQIIRFKSKSVYICENCWSKKKS